MARPGTFDSKRAKARELYDEGYSCNAIARELDCSPSTISRWAQGEALSFDRSQTAMAVRAHTIDMAEDRLLLAKMMVVNAQDALGMLDRPFEVHSFGGKDGDFHSHVLHEAPIEARRNAQAIAAIAFDKLTRVVEKSNAGLEEALGTLDMVANTLEAAVEMYDAEDALTDEPQ